MPMYLRKLILTALLMTFFLSGCAAWKSIDDPVIIGPGESYKVELPGDWMILSSSTNERVTISCDGPSLNMIHVEVATHEDAFKELEKVSSGDMLPSELAELAIAMVKNENGIGKVEVLENRPCTLSDRDAFRVHLKFENQKGLDYERILYGFADAQKVYLMGYQGTSLHYFLQELLVFEELVESFRLSPDVQTAKITE